MHNPVVAPPPGFREVAACLMRDPPSPAPIEAPLETRPPNVMVGPAVATLFTTQIVQDEASQSHLCRHCDLFSGEGGPWESLHGDQSPRAHVGGYH